MKTHTKLLLLLIALFAIFSFFSQTALVFLLLVLIFGLPIWFILHIISNSKDTSKTISNVKKEKVDFDEAKATERNSKLVYANLSKSFLDEMMTQFGIFTVALIGTLLFFHVRIQACPTTTPVIQCVLTNIPFTYLIIAIVIDMFINGGLRIALSAWRNIPANKITYQKKYEKELSQHLSQERAQKADNATFKKLKEKAEQGKKLTLEEEKYLKYRMGAIWYATLMLEFPTACGGDAQLQ